MNGNFSPEDTPYGLSELLGSPISTAKYEAMAKRGQCLPVRETPTDRMCLSTRGESKHVLRMLQDEIERWLRTGFFNSLNICAEDETDKKKRGKPASLKNLELDDEVSEIIRFKLCENALELAATNLQTAIINGMYSSHHPNFQCYAFGEKLVNKCAYCNEEVGVFEGSLFRVDGSECSRCNRRCCSRCSVEKTAREHSCLRCRGVKVAK